MIHFHNLEQGSDEWFEFRKGKLTASNATAIGANGKGLVTYCKKIVSEMKGGIVETYLSKDMERGNELEPIARQMYTLDKGVSIKEVGSITNDKYKNVSISPDGIIGEDGGCEIKARNNEKHFSLIIGETTEIPMNQIQMSLMITEREWWDFVSINMSFSKPLFIKRIYPNEEYFDKLKKGIDNGNELIEKFSNAYELSK